MDKELKIIKLSYEQLNIIKIELDIQLLTTKQLCNKFNVSASLISKIKRMSNFEVVRGPVRNIIKLNILQKKFLAKGINHIIKNNNYAIDCKDITVSTNNLLRTNYPVYFIRSFMKNELNYSYKRIKSRPNQIDMKRLRSIRFLNAVKYNQTITSNTLIFNIDESSLNRHIKHRYGWNIKGVQYEAKNTPFTGSASLWMAIWSNGAWILLITNETINSNKFVMFLDFLNSWLESNEKFGYNDMLVVMDNC